MSARRAQRVVVEVKMSRRVDDATRRQDLAHGGHEPRHLRFWTDDVENAVGRQAVDACRRTGILAASAFTAFAVITIASGVDSSGPAGAFRHPAPAAFIVIAGLAWWGSL